MRQSLKVVAGITGILGICACAVLAVWAVLLSSDGVDSSDASPSERVAEVASPTVQATASPTRIRPTPTMMPTPSPSSQPTVEPTVDSSTLEESTVANVPAVTPINSAVNVRADPGTESAVVGLLPLGQQAVILAQNADSSWFRVALSDGTQGWVGASVVQQIEVPEPAADLAEALEEDGADRTYPIIAPNEYPASSPEYALAEFLQAWQNKDWQKMASVTQLTWREGLSDPASDLRYMFGFKDLLGARIAERGGIGEAWNAFNDFAEASGSNNSTVSVGETAASIGATLYYSISNENVTEVYVTPMIVREVAAYEPDPSGTWGINPLSMLREVEPPLASTEGEVATDTTSYKISDVEEVSFVNTIRYALYVDVVFPITEERIMEICDSVVEAFKQDRDFNAVTVYVSDLDAHYFGFTIARCDYAPNGNWSDAGEVSTGDYDRHRFQYDLQRKVKEPETAIAEMPSPEQMELCEEWMVTVESLDEAGYDPVTESEPEADRRLAEKYNMQTATVQDILLKCIFWASR